MKVDGTCGLLIIQILGSLEYRSNGEIQALKKNTLKYPNPQKGLGYYFFKIQRKLKLTGSGNPKSLPFHALAMLYTGIKWASPSMISTETVSIFSDKAGSMPAGDGEGRLALGSGADWKERWILRSLCEIGRRRPRCARSRSLPCSSR